MSQLALPTSPQRSSFSGLRQLWLSQHGPTWLVLGSILGGWLWLTMAGGDWPAWLVLLMGAPLLCWYGSLQHELIHGHLFSSARWNDRLASVPLNLWLPYHLYRDSHLAHHASPRLADPLADPESYYVSPEQWQTLSALMRRLLILNNTLLGRMVFGPWLMGVGLYRTEWRLWRDGDGDRRRIWGWHALGVLAVLGWLLAWEFPLHRYLLLVVWPGTGLLMVRAFHEHRPATEPAAASVAVEAAWPWRWLFLNNNYHVLHHRSPELPWYRLHRQYWQERSALLTANRHFQFAGYRVWFRRFAWHPVDHPCYPVGMIDAETPRQSAPSVDHRSAVHEWISGSGAGGDHRRAERRAGG